MLKKLWTKIKLMLGLKLRRTPNLLILKTLEQAVLVFDEFDRLLGIRARYIRHPEGADWQTILKRSQQKGNPYHFEELHVSKKLNKVQRFILAALYKLHIL